MKIKMRQMVVGAALMGAAAAGSALAASAITGDTTPSTESSVPATDVPTTDGVINLDPGTGSSGTAGTAGTPACPAPGPKGPRGPKHEELTGTTADQVTAAAQAAVPGGEVLRVEGKAAADTNADETAYHAHVRKADGTHVRVNINADFTVKDIVEGKGPGGPRGPEGRGPKHEELTGTTADQVTAAAQAAVPGGEVLRVEGKAAADTNADETAYHAHVRKADGTHVRVNINADFTVKDIVEGKGPGGPRGPEGGRHGGRHGGHHGGRHGDGHGPCAPAQSAAGSNNTADNGATGSVTAVESSTQV